MKTGGYDSSEQVPTSAETVPGWTPEVGTRIAITIERVGGITRASEIVESKLETVAKWRDGRSRAPLFAMQELARHAGVTLDWIMRGDEAGADEPDRTAGIERKAAVVQAIDEELLGRVTDAISRLYKDERVSLAAIDLGRLAGRKYTEIVAATDDPAERLAMLKLITVQLRAELHASAASPGTGKRSASGS